MTKDKVTFAIWHINDFGCDELDDRLTDITCFHTSQICGTHRNAQIHSRSVERILEATDTDWCLIQAPGSMFIGNVLAHLAEYTDRNDVAAFGHIIDDKNYYSLHHQMMLLNVRLWNANGRPSFGSGVAKLNAVYPAERSDTNVHDDYTPHFLRPAHGAPIKRITKLPGWNFISSAMQHGQRIENFGTALRHAKVFAYPRKDNATEMLHVLQDVATNASAAKDANVVSFSRWASAFTNGIHVLNNEGNEDIPPAYQPVDIGVFVASGLKSNVILHRMGFSSSTNVVFFDFTPATLEFKKNLIERWDGRDFVSFMNKEAPAICEKHRTKVYQDVDFSKTFETMVKQEFGGLDNWLAHWARFRKLRFEYVQCDILRQYETLAAAVKTRGASVLWTSNIFNYYLVIRHFPFSERVKRYQALLKSISKATGSEPITVGGPPAHFGDGQWV